MMSPEMGENQSVGSCVSGMLVTLAALGMLFMICCGEECLLHAYKYCIRYIYSKYRLFILIVRIHYTYISIFWGKYFLSNKYFPRIADNCLISR